MSTHYNKIRHSEIKLQDVPAREALVADDVVEMSHDNSTELRNNPKRLKKKHNPTTPTDDCLPTEKNNGPIAPASVPVRLLQNTYREVYDQQLGDSDYFTVAEVKRPDPDRHAVVIIKTFTGPRAESQVQAIRRVQHSQFVDARDFFPIEGGHLVAFEFMPLALCDIAGNPLLDDVRLASVVGQIVDGLLYLERNGLEHSSLTSSNVLVDLSGNVKLWGQEHIRRSVGACQHAKAVGEIIMYLAHGQARTDGNVGLDDPERFPLAFGFLSATQTTSKLSTITDNAFLRLPWHKTLLGGLVSLTNAWVGFGYRFPATTAGETKNMESQTFS